MENQMPSMPLVPGMQIIKNDVEESVPSSISPTPGVLPEGGASGLDVPSHDHAAPKMSTVNDNNASVIKAVQVPKDGIKVIATRKGFYNQHRIEENEEFILSKIEHLGSWMTCKDPDLEKHRKEVLKNKKAGK